MDINFIDLSSPAKRLNKFNYLRIAKPLLWSTVIVWTLILMQITFVNLATAQSNYQSVHSFKPVHSNYGK